MKKQLSIVLLLVLGMIALNAQTIIYKAGFGESTTTENWNDAVYADLNDENIILVWKMGDDVLTINNKYNDKFVLGEGTISDHEDGYKSVFIEAYDKEGRECTIVVSYYKTTGSFDGDGMYSTRIRVAYPDIWYGYYCIIKSKSGFE